MSFFYPTPIPHEKIIRVTPRLSVVQSRALLAASFKGKVHFKITTGQSSQNMDCYVKRGVARIDVQIKNTNACVILNSAKQEMMAHIL